MKEKELLPDLFRTEYRKIISVLVRFFGFDQITLAEDLASDTFLTAAETWGIKGLPENPVAWLYTVAKNKARDYLKHQQVFNQKIKSGLRTEEAYSPDSEIDLSDENIRDSQLQMMFAVSHPALSPESRLALILRVLCGFGVDEIADAFLTNKETIHKRLVRAKEKLRTEKIKISMPPAAEIDNRLDTVLTALYLLFNEGYYSSSRNTVLRKDFCLEAMRLTLLLSEIDKIGNPSVDALFALMCFHASRFEARTDENGEIVRYEDQDRTLWNDELIDKGNCFLNKASRGKNVTRYHIEAAIAYWHTRKNDADLKWENILSLYNQLLIQEYSPIMALNRTYALFKVKGRESAIAEAEKLNLQKNHLYHVLLGHLYKSVDNEKARHHLEQALSLANTEQERFLIRQDIDNLKILKFGNRI